MLFILKMTSMATLLKLPEGNKIRAMRSVRNSIVLATIQMRTMST